MASTDFPPVIALAATQFADSDVLNRNCVTCIFSAGGVPLIVPLTTDSSVLETILARVDGAFLPGGIDINPLLYGEEPLPQLNKIDPALDDFHGKFIDAALKFELPLFGICRGEQLLNVHFGGTLHQDMTVAFSGKTGRIKHVQGTTAKDVNTHHVDVTAGSKLRDIMGRDRFLVNSSHHQAVRDVAPGFRVTAVAKDGVIEGIEKEDDPRIYGVQWHPEGPVGEGDHEFLPLFKYLVDQAREVRRRRNAK
jgi:putative glutamine amidotransferase